MRGALDAREALGDIVGQGPHGPIIDVGAHGRDWKKIRARLDELGEGEAPGALSHPDVGPIDVMRGKWDAAKKEGYGLEKLRALHPEVIEDLPQLIAGMKVASRSANRIILESAEHRALVRLDWDGAEKTWLLTAYSKDGRRGGGSTLVSSGHQADHSSASPTNKTIAQKPASSNAATLRVAESETALEQSRRGEGTPVRLPDHQADISSASPAKEDIAQAVAGSKDATLGSAGSETALEQSRRGEGTPVRLSDHQADVSSASPAKEDIAQAADISNDAAFVESRRAEGSTGRSDSLQADTSSASPTPEDIAELLPDVDPTALSAPRQRIDEVRQSDAIAFAEDPETGRISFEDVPAEVRRKARGRPEAQRTGKEKKGIPNYRKTFLTAHPHLKSKVVVHHSVEQQVQKEYPELFSVEEIHDLSNLRGIPNALNRTLHLKKIRKKWNKFYKTHPKATREQILEMARRIDKKYGKKFDPPYSEDETSSQGE